MKQFSKFHDRKANPAHGEADPSSNNDVFNAVGEDWKRLRSISAPSFSVKGLKKVSRLQRTKTSGHANFDRFNKQHDRRTEEPGEDDQLPQPALLLPRAQRRHHLSNRSRSKRLAHVSQPNFCGRQELLPKIREVSQTIFKNLTLRSGRLIFLLARALPPSLSRWLRKIGELTAKVSKSSLSSLQHSVSEAVDERIREKVEQRFKKRIQAAEQSNEVDFIDLVLDENSKHGYDVSRQEKPEHKLTADEIKANCLIFLLAGSNFRFHHSRLRHHLEDARLDVFLHR